MKVNLTYFKPSGKYYSEGSYETECINLFQVWYEVRGMKEDGELPEIIGGDWIISVDVPDHEHNHPHLIL